LARGPNFDPKTALIAGWCPVVGVGRAGWCPVVGVGRACARSTPTTEHQPAGNASGGELDLLDNSTDFNPVFFIGVRHCLRYILVPNLSQKTHSVMQSAAFCESVEGPAEAFLPVFFTFQGSLTRDRSHII